MMFQKPSLYPWMNVRQKAESGLIFAGTPDPEKIDRLIENRSIPNRRSSRNTTMNDSHDDELSYLQQHEMSRRDFMLGALAMGGLAAGMTLPGMGLACMLHQSIAGGRE